MFALTGAPIDVAAVRAAVVHAGAGAVILFEGTARDSFEGRAVKALEYEAFHEMAVPVMAAIGREAAERWPGTRTAMVHRIGHLEIGETSVVIAVSGAHRAEVYEASRFAIEALKARVPVWKKEIYADGAAWKANAQVP